MYVKYSSEVGTKKYEDAIKKGIEVVDEDWIREKINEIEETTNKKQKNTKKESKLSSSSSNLNELPLSGLCFAISGKLIFLNNNF